MTADLLGAAAGLVALAIVVRSAAECVARGWL